MMLEAWRERARGLWREFHALALAARDRRTPVHARPVVLATVGNALCPVDPVPDVRPVVGYLDDLVVVGAGVAIAVRLILDAVLAESRERAREAETGPSTRARWVVAAVVALWGAVAYGLLRGWGSRRAASNGRFPRNVPPSPVGDTHIYRRPDPCIGMADLLTDDEIEEGLPEGWERDGDEIVRTYEFDAYLEGVGFAAAAGGLAEEAFHHPEITIEWREVEVRLTTHDAGGITENDLDLAARFNEIA